MAEEYVFEIEEGVRIMPIRCMIYGPPGVGKTTLVAGAEDPLFADLEQGSVMLNVARNKKPIDTWEKLMALTSHVANGKHKYKTYVLDTLDKAEQLLHDYLCRTNKNNKGNVYPVSRVDDIGGGFGRGYDAAVEEGRRFCALLEKIWERGIAYVLIAHAKLENVHNPTGPDYDRYNLAIHKKLCGMFYAMCDIVLFANNPLIVKNDTHTDDKRYRAIGGDARYLYTRGGAAYMAKNRYGLNQRIEMSWDTLMAGVKAGNSPAALKTQIAEKLSRINNADVSAKVAEKMREIGDNVAGLITITGRLDANLAKLDEQAAAAEESRVHQVSVAAAAS